MTDTRFVHLNVQTAYSMLNSTIHVKPLAKRCRDLGMPAVAITDVNSLAGYSVFDKVMIEAGVQPVMGAKVTVLHPEREGTAMSQVVLLVKDDVGYDNLVKLFSAANQHAENDLEPHVTLPELRERNEGLILLTGGAPGPITKAAMQGDLVTAERRLSSLKSFFGDRIYLEIQRVADGASRETETALIALADKLDVPLVATQAACFLDPSDHEAHDVLLCVADGTYLSVADRRRVSSDHHLASPQEMRERFADIPDACDNTLVIAQRCAIGFKKRKPILPTYPGLDGETEEECLRRMATEGLERRFKQLNLPSEKHPEYHDRLTMELDVISRMGFPGYFLIVQDFINWAKSNDIPVGPGRGSGAGSLVAYSVGITDLDPIRYDLLFERFLNPDRVSMPDFDVDFCQQRRGEVIDYVRRRYGDDRVAQIGTFGQMHAKAAVRDVGRVMQIPFPVVDKYARMLPGGAKPEPLATAMTMDPLKDELPKAPDDVKRMFALALKVENAFRNASTHAAGVVIADRPVHELVPIMRDSNGNLPTNFDMKAVESAGLVKFDFLGLKTLDVIDGAVKMANAQGAGIDFNDIGVTDDATYKMLADGDTFGVFQLESAGMRQAVRQIMPTDIEDIVALVSLYRPGPMDEIPRYAAIKHGRDVPSYLHKDMEPVLAKTNSIIIYQEQVMQLARVLAGYSLGQADLLRRAMGKKIKEEMDKQRGVFQAGAEKNGIDAATASSIFDLIAKFADYGFNRSHAAAYSVVAFQTAWLKRHFPHEFFASSMNLDINDTEKLAAFFAEMRSAKIAFLGPDVNRSQALFSVEGAGADKNVRWALAGVRGVGVTAMEQLAAERTANGPFKSFTDLVQRTGAFLNKKAYESLAMAGATDSLKGNRAAKLAALPRLLKQAQHEAKEKQSAQISMFDLGLTANQTGESLPNIPEMDRIALLNGEFTTLGVYFTGHPIDELAPALRKQSVRPLMGALMSPNGYREVKIAGLVTKMILKTTKKLESMAVLIISDPTGMAEAVVFPSDYERLKDRLRQGAAFIFTVKIQERDGGEKQILVNDVQALDLDISLPAAA